MDNLDASQRGNLSQQILVAGPELLDPEFRRSLVFLVGHDREGAMGLVLNRPTGRTLGDILGADEGPPFLNRIPLYFGGPVRRQDVLLVMFTWSECGKTFECVCSPEEGTFEQTFKHPRHELRAFLGCAGWGEGQLEMEIAEGAWRVVPPHPLMFREPYCSRFWRVLDSGDTRWERLVPRLPLEQGWN